MTKKDFELLAEVIRYLPKVHTLGALEPALDRQQVGVVAQEFAFALTRTNPRFDRDRFLKACGL